jgi:iron(III) transport system ATP-binding protein
MRCAAAGRRHRARRRCPGEGEIIRKAFRGSEFLYTLRLASGEQLMAHVPSHHDHKLGEWIGIRAEVDHVVTFNRACPVN